MQQAVTRTCKPVENNYSRRMVKKASGAIGGASSTSPKSEKPAEKLGRRGTPPSETRQKPSALLDIHVVYYHCDWHASHYVKAMLDQIFGNYKCNCF
jgi:hypothetical protein